MPTDKKDFTIMGKEAIIVEMNYWYISIYSETWEVLKKDYVSLDGILDGVDYKNVKR